MFETLLSKVEINISTVSLIIQANEQFRGIAALSSSSESSNLADSEYGFHNLIKTIPGDKEWKVYDHCSVVTRLYAIYERFVEDLLTLWLNQLPELVPSYSALSEKIQFTHRTGVARLLLDLNKTRFQHLCIEDVIRGLLYGVTGESQYELVCDAFLLHEQNLRKDKLEEVFANAGIEGTWNWIKTHRSIKYYVSEVRGNQTSAESELNNFIEYRNYAAHGKPIDEILGTEALLDLCSFIKVLCEALAELVCFHVIQKKELLGRVRKTGYITEWLKRPKAAVAKVQMTSLSINLPLILVSKTLSYCQEVTIKSIRIDDNPIDTVTITDETEVGLQFDVDVRKDLDILQFEPELQQDHLELLQSVDKED